MPLFDLKGVPGLRSKMGWIFAVALHVIGVVALFVLPLAAPWGKDRPAYVTLVPETPPYNGTDRPRSRRPSGFAKSKQPSDTATPQAPLPVPPPPVVRDSGPPPRPDAGLSLFESLQPRMGDGLAWVPPRPALPAEVAEALYGVHDRRDSAAVQRLRAMVDSLNQILTEEQRERRKPVWTTTVAGTAFGIDSQYIHVAGIKIPTAALALLPIRLPEGNYDEQLRARHLQEMREDLLQAAARAETYHDFKRYVQQLRARKQAERDAEKRRRGEQPDTVKAIP
ncbi:MAG TPA: hypothetical protein VEO73_08040 [Gemmatimonadales bacterium]|nr:hypothetical protein [Gemmatimonadales bacterium]